MMIYERKQIEKLLAKTVALEGPYAGLLFETVAELSVRRFDTRDHLRQVPEAVEWTPIARGDRWGGPFQTMWLEAELTIASELAGRKVVLCADTGAHEALAFIDGKPSGMFNKDGDEHGANHSIVLLSSSATAGSSYRVALECHAGSPHLGTAPYEHYGMCRVPDSEFVRTFGSVTLCAIREDVSDFLFDLRTVNQLLSVLDTRSRRYGDVLGVLMEAYSAVSQYPADVAEPTWRGAMANARTVLRKALDAGGGSRTGRVGLVGHSHMDTAWLWTVDETKRKCARTYANALALMEWYPEYTFVQSSMLHASWMKELYPDIFETMKWRVAEGRYEPNGAVWVECDCNVTGGESMVRQFLWGQRFSQKEFGYLADAFWLPDTFGYNAAIPQIMNGCGVKYFLTTKMEWNESNRFPFESFRWSGLDGTTVLVHLNRTHVWPDVRTAVANFQALPDKHVSTEKLVAYGFGDGGGGPQYQMLEMARRISDLDGCPQSTHTTVSQFMQRLERSAGTLPLWSGELYLELHRGTLTMMHDMKRSNRQAEFALRDYEAAAVVASLRNGVAIDRAKLHDWWSTVLQNQFHDILPGTCIPEVYDRAIPENYRVVEEARAASASLLGGLGSAGDSVAIFNSLGWHRSGQICIGIDAGLEGTPCQRIVDVTGAHKLAALVSLPPLSVRSYGHAPAVPENGRSAFTFDGMRLETPFASVLFGADGSIESFVDRASGRELRRDGGAPLNTFFMAEDVPFIYDNWDIDADIVLKTKPSMDLVSRRVVSDGPLQIRIESEFRISDASTITQHMVFYSDTPRVDFETLVDWHDNHRLLKVGFDVNILSPVLKSETQFGHIDRPTHANTSWDAARTEVCNHKWSDLSESRFGVAILNDSKYGISCVGSDMRLTLMKGGCRPDPRGDEGSHLFTYALLPHEGAFSAETVVRAAYELNVPPVALAGTDASAPSLCVIDAPNIVVEAVKPAEDGTGYIVRMYECERNAVAAATIGFGFTPKRVRVVDMLERPLSDLTVRDGEVNVPFRPFEIKTLLVE